MADKPSIDADLEGPASPPHANGEIVFGAPWERRAFGLAIALCRSGGCEWEAFRGQLIGRIAEDPGRPYWQSWVAALEDVLARTSKLIPAELDARHQSLLERAAGHDHR